MNSYRDLVNKLEAIQNRVNEGELDRMAAQGFQDPVPAGYTRTPQGEILPNNPAGQAKAQQQMALQQAMADRQIQDMNKMSDWAWQQATKNGPVAAATPAQRAARAAAAAQREKEWEEGVDDATVSSDQMLTSDEPTNECGGEMTPHAPSQSDSVTMNVSMNGSGKGGIRDLLDVLRNIENAVDEPQGHGEPDMIVGMEDESIDGGFGSATTSPEQEIAGVDAVTATGNDMHSKGAEAEKVNGGGNPFNVDEGLMSQLANLYQEVKLR